MLTAEIDTKRFEVATNALLSAMPGDIRRVVATEAGQLAHDIAGAVGPASKSAANLRIAKDIKAVVSSGPRTEFKRAQQRDSEKYGEFTWLAAGPQWLLGIADDDNKRSASPEDIARQYYNRKDERRGKAYVRLGKRGAQSVWQLNRLRTTKANIAKLASRIKAKVGLLKASFAATAQELIPSKRIPGWVREKITLAQSSGKSELHTGGLASQQSPSLVFGSFAKGVESQPKIAAAIGGQLRRREIIMANKLKKLLAGYKYDYENGRVFRPRGGELDNGH